MPWTENLRRRRPGGLSNHQLRLHRDLRRNLSPSQSIKECLGGDPAHLFQRLAHRGQTSIAASYADFYLAGWDGFRSGFDDDAAAGRALMAVSRMYAEGSELVREFAP